MVTENWVNDTTRHHVIVLISSTKFPTEIFFNMREERLVKRRNGSFFPKWRETKRPRVATQTREIPGSKFSPSCFVLSLASAVSR